MGHMTGKAGSWRSHPTLSHVKSMFTEW